MGVEHKERITLPDEERDTLLDMLKNPPEPNEALRELLTELGVSHKDN